MVTETPINPAAILLYNTQNIDEATLKAQFSIRKKEYKQIWQDIKTNPMEYPATHYLIQGVRGAGKTTLLARLSYAVSDEDSLNTWLIPILFNEEEYGVFSLFTFWLRIAQKLALYDASRYEPLYAGLSQLSSDKEVQAWSLIRQTLIEHQQKIIVFIDNMAELFDGFTDNENAQLREVLSLHPEIRLIGGSSVILDAHFDGTAPFYQFFKLVNLKAISETEMHELLRTLAKHTSNEAVERIEEIITQHPERIEAVRRLTDGVPRTIVLLFQIIMEGAKDSSFAYLEETIDKTTPLYKHRMDDLTRQQQVIVNAIAMNWDAMNVKEIAEQTRLPSKTISAQLAVLQKRWVVDKVETNTKNHLYLLKERFFNIWYLMRYGTQQDRRRVLWLTKFLESWYSDDELSLKLVNYLGKISTNDNNIQDLLINALLASDKIDIDIRRTIKDTYERRYDKKSVILNNQQEKIKVRFNEIVKTCSEKELFEFIESNVDSMSLLDYLNYSHYLYNKESELFNPTDILFYILSRSTTGFFEILYIFIAIYKRNLIGYKKESIGLLKEIISDFEVNLINDRLTILTSVYLTLHIWNDDFEEFSQILNSPKYKATFDDSLLSTEMKLIFFQEIIHMLLVKQQYEMTYQLFDRFKLHDLLKPYYYATLSYLTDERQQDYLRMGDELKPSVEEVIASVAQFREMYALEDKSKNNDNE